MRVFRKIMALTLAVALTLSMGAVTALAAELPATLIWYADSQGKTAVDNPTMDININKQEVSTIGTIYCKTSDNQSIKSVDVVAKDGIVITAREWQGSNNRTQQFQLKVAKADGSQYTKADEKTVKTTANITFSNGYVMEDVPFTLIIGAAPLTKVKVYNENGEEMDPEGTFSTGVTYTMEVKIIDLADKTAEGAWKEPKWDIRWYDSDNDWFESADGLGTPVVDYPFYKNTVVFSKLGEFITSVNLESKDGEYKARGSLGSNVVNGKPQPPQNRDFYFGDESHKIYSGSRLLIDLSVNKNEVWQMERFVSKQQVKSVSVDSARAKAKNDAQSAVDGGYVGDIGIVVRDDDATPNVWEKDDIGKQVEFTLTVTLADNTKLTFPIKETIGASPRMSYGSALDSEGKDVLHENIKFFPDPADAAKNKYTYDMHINDLGEVLGNSVSSTDWKVTTGDRIAAFAHPNVVMDSSNKAENTLTISGRGTVILKISEKYTHPDYVKQKNSHIVSFAVSGAALPIGASDLEENTVVGNDKLEITIGNSNSLDSAALEAIKAKAAKEGVANIELKLDGGVSMAIGVSGLSDPAFLAALGGKPFDPLVMLTPPDAVSETDIDPTKGQWLDFAHTGALPGKTKVTLNVDSDLFTDVTDLVLWYFRPEDKKLIKDAAGVEFDGDRCTVELTHCSAWALYPEGYDPNTGREENGNNNNNSGSSSSGGSSSAPSYPTAEKGLVDLAKIKDLTPGSLPANAKLTKTAAGKDIAVIPVTLIDGSMGITDLNLLGKLGANVGLEIKQNGVDIIIPGGFGAITEVGRFSYPMAFNKLATNSADMLGAVKGEGAVSYTCTIGGNVTLPTTATVTLTTDIKKDGNVNVYRYDAAAGKPVFAAKGKVVGSKVIFATKQLGQFMVTTGSI